MRWLCGQATWTISRDRNRLLSWVSIELNFNRYALKTNFIFRHEELISWIRFHRHLNWHFFDGSFSALLNRFCSSAGGRRWALVFDIAPLRFLSRSWRRPSTVLLAASIFDFLGQDLNVVTDIGAVLPAVFFYGWIQDSNLVWLAKVAQWVLSVLKNVNLGLLIIGINRAWLHRRLFTFDCDVLKRLIVGKFEFVFFLTQTVMGCGLLTSWFFLVRLEFRFRQVKRLSFLVF